MIDKVKAFFAGRLNESGALPAIMAGCILIAATAVLLAGFSVTTTRNAELNAVKTNTNFYLNACESHLEAALVTTIPEEFNTNNRGTPNATGLNAIKGAIAKCSSDTVVIAFDTAAPPTLYTPAGQSKATSVKATLTVTVKKGTYSTGEYTKAVKYLDYAKQTGAALTSDSYIESFDADGNAVWVTPTTAPVPTTPLPVPTPTPTPTATPSPTPTPTPTLPAAPTDTTPKLTTLTYKCAVDTNGTLPMRKNVTGTVKWSDGATKTYSGAVQTDARVLKAGVEYKVTLDGTYESMSARSQYSWETYTACLQAVNHWGTKTGVTNAFEAFSGATNLTDVPKTIPDTITNMGWMFDGTTKFNDSDINYWNVSKVTSMNGMFCEATSFNQTLFNWNTSQVDDMGGMFWRATAFNSDISNWNVSNVLSMGSMFNGAVSYNKPLDKWNVAKVTDMESMFNEATAFQQNLSGWKTTSLLYGGMFAPASYPNNFMPPKTSK